MSKIYLNSSYWSKLTFSKLRFSKSIYFVSFCGLNMSEDSVECESFTVISIDSLLMTTNFYLQLYLDNCV